MKIYDRPGTPNAARIRIVLAGKGLDDSVEFIPVNLMAAEQKQDWFLDMNPLGKTPVLVLDSGEVISESGAITEYLDSLDGNPVFTGRNGLERATIQMLHRRAEMMLLEPVDDYFHYGTRGLGEALRPWRMPDWADEEKQAWGRRRGDLAVANMVYFDKVLQSRPFLAGEAFSLADITLFAGLTFAVPIGLPCAEELTKLHAWLHRVKALPAVANRSGQSWLSDDSERRPR